MRAGQTLSRRRSLSAMAAMGVGAGASREATAEPPPETSRIRLVQMPSNCFAPQYVAEEMLRAEGFSDLRYVPMASTAKLYPALASGEIDMTMAFIAPFVAQADGAVCALARL